MIIIIMIMIIIVILIIIIIIIMIITNKETKKQINKINLHVFGNKWNSRTNIIIIFSAILSFVLTATINVLLMLNIQ